MSKILCLASLTMLSMLSASQLSQNIEHQAQNRNSPECVSAILQLTRFIHGENVHLDEIIRDYVSILSERELLSLSIGFENYGYRLYLRRIPTDNPYATDLDRRVSQVFNRVEEELQKRVKQRQQDKALLYTSASQLRIYARGEHPLTLDEIISSFDKYLSLGDLLTLVQGFFEQSEIIAHSPHSSLDDFQFAIKLIDIGEQLLRIAAMRAQNPDNL